MKRISHRSAVFLVSLVSLVGLALFIFLFQQNIAQVEVPNVAQESAIDSWTIESSAMNGLPLKENKVIYQSDPDGGVDAIYLTIFPTDTPEGQIDYSIFDYHQAFAQDFNPTLDANAMITVNDGPLSPLVDTDTINASIRVRGNSARGATVKSFRVELLDQKDNLQGLKVLNLNKHVNDISKIANKFSMDLMEQLDHFASLRTRFVHVYVRDAAADDARVYKDHGLYTLVEQPNKTYLESHGLDPDGTIYKAERFEFRQYEDLKNVDDPDYDEVLFETVLGIREAKDHSKLLKMVEHINNVNEDFTEIFPLYFNEENYLTWMAVNILLGNGDTIDHNFMLYSPSNSLTWYFLPWDYDGTFHFGAYTSTYQVPPSLRGFQQYTGVLLHRRYFLDQSHVDKLTEKIELLRSTLFTEEKVMQQLERYRPVLNQFMVRNPDLGLLDFPPSELNAYLDQFPVEIDKNYQLYMESLKYPLPVFTAEPESREQGYYFSWESSRDMQQNTLKYRLIVAKDPALEQIMIDSGNIAQPYFDYPLPIEPGTYFMAVTIIDSDGHSQISLDSYKDLNQNDVYYGVRQVILGGQ
ncbi:MAG: hypothetical protein EOM08_08795 [Clostridia bacterium]|nr:hypothetical protein [Clostridia bacterium]